jgi:N-acetylglucosamine-6-phosphate deacetylase
MTTLFSGARKLDAHGQVDDFWMLVEGNSIVSVGSGPQHPPADLMVDVAGRRLVPGFLDLHGHGGGGFAFDDGGEALVAALATHRAHGTTRSVVSLVANPVPELRASLAAVAALARTDPLVLGTHLEGPFLAVGRRGAHNAAFLLEPDLAVLDELLNAAHGTLRQVTIAPELDGALELVDVLVEAGVVVAMGHSYADFAIAQDAFDRGVRLVTHAFNAMSGIHHRAPGPVVAAFEDERVTLELILDGEHVHPDVAALTFRSAAGRVALVTDAMAAAGSTDGDYQLGALNVAVRDGLALLRGTTTIAGSTLTQDRALRVAIAQAHVDQADAVAALTLTPARVLGLEHRHGLLAPGYVADAVILNSHWQVDEVWADGERIVRR